MHFSARAIAVGLRAVAEVALEGAGEVGLVVVPDAVRDLPDGEVGEAEQPRGLEHHAVEDQLLRRAAGEPLERLGERRPRHGEIASA